MSFLILSLSSLASNRSGRISFAAPGLTLEEEEEEVTELVEEEEVFFFLGISPFLAFSTYFKKESA